MGEYHIEMPPDGTEFGHGVPLLDCAQIVSVIEY